MINNLTFFINTELHWQTLKGWLDELGFTGEQFAPTGEEIANIRSGRGSATFDVLIIDVRLRKFERHQMGWKRVRKHNPDHLIGVSREEFITMVVGESLV